MFIIYTCRHGTPPAGTGSVCGMWQRHQNTFSRIKPARSHETGVPPGTWTPNPVIIMYPYVPIGRTLIFYKCWAFEQNLPQYRRSQIFKLLKKSDSTSKSFWSFFFSFIVSLINDFDTIKCAYGDHIIYLLCCPL